MEEQILVTIVTVCYNSEETIQRTIESVLSQTYKNIEYIIIDGKSTDNTIKIVNNFIQKGQSIKLVSEKDSGIYQAMNKGIRLSSGEIIGILNSDDWYENDTVEKIMNIYQSNQNKNGIIYGAMRLYENSIESYTVYYNHQFLEKQMINHPTCFVAKSIYQKYGLFDESYRAAGDYDFMLRIFNAEKKEKISIFHGTHDVLANFSIGGMSSSFIAMKEQDIVFHEYGLMNNKRFYSRKIVRYIKRFLRYY